MSLKSILIGFTGFILLLIGSLIILDTYTLKSIVNDAPIVSSVNPSATPLSPQQPSPSKQSASALSQKELSQKDQPSRNVATNTTPKLSQTSSNETPVYQNNRGFNTQANATTGQTLTTAKANQGQTTSSNSDLEQADNNQNNEDKNALEDDKDNLPIFTAGDISGRIFSDGGAIVPNIILTATPYDITAGQSKTAANILNAKTDELGQYSFNAVPKASYRICTQKNEQYTQSCINVLPPQRTADLKISSLSNSITVAGVVSDQAGLPLANVNVRVNVAGASTIKTQADGSYQLAFRMTSSSTPSIQFSLQNYTQISKQIFESQENKSTNVTINASLTTQNNGFVVQGRLIDRQGEPARGQRVRLRSSSDRNKSTQYAISDAEGIFTISGVKPGNDYLPLIITSADYQYNKPENQAVIIVADNVANITIELEKLLLNYQPMALFLATQAQQPISGLTLNLSYRGKFVERAVTDASGGATFEKVPNGNLLLSIASLNLRVSGLSRDKHSGVTILADKGDNEARITVLGENGQAVVCQRATISWSQVQNDLQVNASRSVQSDQSGVIYATDFGSGEHTLGLGQCDGYKNYSGKLDIGTETNFSVTLSPL